MPTRTSMNIIHPNQINLSPYPDCFFPPITPSNSWESLQPKRHPPTNVNTNLYEIRPHLFIADSGVARDPFSHIILIHDPNCTLNPLDAQDLVCHAKLDLELTSPHGPDGLCLSPSQLRTAQQFIVDSGYALLPDRECHTKILIMVPPCRKAEGMAIVATSLARLSRFRLKDVVEVLDEDGNLAKTPWHGLLSRDTRRWLEQDGHFYY